MVRIRLASAASMGAVAVLFMLLLGGHQAQGQDLKSKLEAKEAKLSKVHARRGVLTTTIAHFVARIDRLTSRVAALRTQEAAVRSRLRVKQGQLDKAMAVLGVAK